MKILKWIQAAELLVLAVRGIYLIASSDKIIYTGRAYGLQLLAVVALVSLLIRWHD